MNIEVAVSKSATTKEKGDLLEELATHLLRAQNYEVEQEVRKTGVELDLLCKHKANNNKKLYVECKAYKDDKNIDAGIILKLLGAMQLAECEEAWIICTCELGKEAKGVADQLTSKGRTDITIYTPDKLIAALVDANVIKSESIANHSVSKILGRNSHHDSILLVTPEGIYWTYREKKEKTDTSVFVVNAKTGDIVDDSDILSRLSTFDSTMYGLEFCTPISASISTTNGKDVGKYKFRLNDEYVQSIKDTGVMYTHPHKRVLDKDDLFIFPDLQLVNEDDKISSAKLMSFDEQYRKNIIFGDELSGKTTLAQKLQRTHVESGNIPVYINAYDINSSNLEKFHKILRRQIKLQYANVTDEIVDTIDKSKIIIFIDDFHNIKLNKEATSQFFLAIDKEYESILWLINTRYELELLANSNIASELANYNLYRIKELGFKLRDEMIKTWISIGRIDTIHESDKHKQVMEIADIINSTIGYNYVPTYPIYVLTLLQSFEASTVKSLQGSAYAEFYNYLITHALGTAGVKAAELDLYYSLLSELSYCFFVDSQKEMSEHNVMEFYEKFCNRKMLDKKFDKTKTILTQSKILKSENDSYWFNHSYIYYFFVGKYLSDNARKDDVQQKIIALTKRLYLREFANIVIFLVHFSKDQFVLDNILLEAKKIFTEVSLATFAKDEFANINCLIEAELRIILEDKRPEETRAKQLEIEDSLNENLPKEPTNETDYNSDIKELDIFGQINLAFKIIEILGQITKNYYGSLDGDVKINLLEETYNLGLRSLKKIMTEFNEYTGFFEQEISRYIQDKSISEKERNTLSKRLIFAFATLISLGFVTKVANSVASKELSAIYEAVYKEDPNISKQLINIAIELDFPNGLDTGKIINLASEIRDNHIPSMLLKMLVIRHIYKFHIPYDKRQKICDKLNIGIENQKKALSSVK